MATTITSECINCGACEPECPNTAIYGGGVPWELDGETHPAIAQDIYYIVAAKCTECVGFHDHEACAAVCPVDCCIPDPNNLESERVLIERAKVLHPEQNFGTEFPSRFRKQGDGAVAKAEGGAPANADGGAAAAKADGATAPPASAAAPAAPAAPKPAAAEAAAAPKGAAFAAPVAMLNLPKDIGALPGPIGEKHFPGEIEENFETVLAAVDMGPIGGAPVAVRIAMRLAEPLLGAMPEGPKARLEEAVGPSGFSRARSTALNILLNLILYPAILTGFSVAIIGDRLFSLHTNGWITLGLLMGAVEAMWRLREGMFHARPASDLIYRGCWYGLVLGPLGTLLASGNKLNLSLDRSLRKVAFDGFKTDQYDEKIERDRRYGTVYSVMEHANAYLVRLEMPRRIPASSLKRLWNLADEMPDYDYNIGLEDGVLTIRASVRGEALRRLSYISSSFPADFLTRIEFDKPVASFKHRLRDKVIEVIVFKGDAGEIKDAA